MSSKRVQQIIKYLRTKDKKDARKNYLACEKKKEDVIKVANFKNVDKYKDITKEMIEKATPNSNRLVFNKVFVDDNNIKHPILGKEKTHPIPRSGDEYETGKWLKKTFGGKIHFVPRISDISNEGIKTSTPDYIWNNEKWDLKTPGNTLESKFENSIERFVKKAKIKKQAKNLIIDFKNYPDKTNKEIIELANKTMSNPYRTDRIDTLILKKGDELIKVYKKI